MLEVKNDDISYALEYHQATKHSEISTRTSAHYLDWENRPYPFKVYEGQPSITLPRDFPRPESNALDTLLGPGSEGRGEPSISELAELLFFSAGLTRKMRFGSETHYMRAASATGALYPIELYVVCKDIPGLGPGVYHFNPLDFALVQLRPGDFRAELATLSDERIRSAPVTVAFTSFAWRNAWKYEARSYRHWFWDGGVIAANLLAVAASMNLHTRLVMGFVDSEVNKLLGLKEEKEATVLLVPVGSGRPGLDRHTLKTISHVEPKVRPLSRREVEYPEIWQLHRASSLTAQDEVGDWVHSRHVKSDGGRPTSPIFPLGPAETGSSSQQKLANVILKRGSTRRFAVAPVKFSQLSTILRALTGPLLRDYSQDGESLIDTYLIANAVDRLPSGSYFFDSKKEQLEQLKPGQFRYMSRYLCLEQGLFGDASVLFFLMTRLEDVLGAYGNRGYRAAQLEGGIIAGRIYLSAYAQGLGASGTTFYDDAVTEFFSPHAKDKSTMIAVGLGLPAYKAKPGRVLPQFSPVS